MKPKSAGKRVQWAIRFMGVEEIVSGRYSNQEMVCRVKRLWERHDPKVHYELVKITTEPVETKKRKSTKQTKRN